MNDGHEPLITLLMIAGGVALILFGVRFLRKGLDRLFGNRLGDWLGRAASNRFRAFLSGLAVSGAVPSSTTMSVLTAQTVQAGHMTTRQMLAVMFGADIGLTLPVVLIALRMERYAPILVLVGVVLYQFTVYTKSRGVGQSILSLGFIFLGIDTIKRAAVTAADNPDLMKLLEIAQRYPVGVAVLAALLTFGLQSGTATIGLAIGLGAVGAVDLPVAVAVVVGANVGVVITSLIVAWGQIDSRRLAVCNLLAKTVVAAAVLAALSHVVVALQWLPGLLDRRVAYAHTGFNIILAAVGLPLVGPLTRLIEVLVPRPPSTQQPQFGPRYIHTGPTDSLSLALDQSRREIMHVAEIVRGMLGDLWKALKTNDVALANAVSERDDQIDLLDAQIKRFLTRELRMQGDSADAGEQMRQLRYLNELENIGDIIDKNLSELVIKKSKLGTEFSGEGWQELDDFYGKVTQNMLIADTAFTTRDRALAQQLLNHKERINQYERQLRDEHFARLQAGLAASHESSAIHLDILTHLKRINSCVSHVAYAILQDDQGGGGA